MNGESEPTNLFSTPSPVVQNSTTMLPSETRRRKNRSAIWNDFKLDINSKNIVICNHYDKKLKYNGTSSMITHSKICKSNPNNDFNKRQRTLTPSMNSEGHALSSPSVSRFDQEKLRHLLVKVFVDLELPFTKVEHPDFHEFVNGLNLKFNNISRTTLARDILLLWDAKKEKIETF
ncbi:unnamed protein product [Lathyrus sativus]|nr:unnamed protein product [Lathyrus sativus]